MLQNMINICIEQEESNSYFYLTMEGKGKEILSEVQEKQKELWENHIHWPKPNIQELWCIAANKTSFMAKEFYLDAKDKEERMHFLFNEVGVDK